MEKLIPEAWKASYRSLEIATHRTSQKASQKSLEKIFFQKLQEDSFSIIKKIQQKSLESFFQKLG